MSNSNPPIEIEGRILDIDADAAAATLLKLGAKFIGSYNFRRYVFDVIPATPNTWIRLRTDGVKTTLTVKNIVDDTVEGTQEFETKVDDFDTALEILKLAGLTPRGYQENKRMLYELDGTEVCIDTWPKIPTYLEIEASSEAQIQEIATKLGYKAEQVIGEGVEKIYSHYGINLKEIAELTF